MGDSRTRQFIGVGRPLQQWVGRVLNEVAQWMAVAGGTLLAGLSALTIASVTGRAFIWAGLGPVPGDFELMEAGCAFAVFSFLPWCQLRRGHVTVDVFITWLPLRHQEALSVIGNALMTVAAVVVALQFQSGLMDKLKYPETTFILEFPIWWGYAASLPGAWLFAIVCAYTVWRSLNDSLAGGELSR